MAVWILQVMFVCTKEIPDIIWASTVVLKVYDAFCWFLLAYYTSCLNKKQIYFFGIIVEVISHFSRLTVVIFLCSQFPGCQYTANSWQSSLRVQLQLHVHFRVTASGLQWLHEEHRCQWRHHLPGFLRNSSEAGTVGRMWSYWPKLQSESLLE